jgi:hypothetical protein
MFSFGNYGIAASGTVSFQFAHGLFVSARTHHSFLVVLETASASEMCYMHRTES